MAYNIHFKKIIFSLKCNCFIGVCMVVMALFLSEPCPAFDVIGVFGKPLRVMGYINQGVGYGIGGDHYDTKEDWQSFKYDLMLEAQYELQSNLRFFVSGMLSGDFAFDIMSDNKEWNKKGFSDARDNLAHDTVLRDLLYEAHITWTPGNMLFRIGKQIVVWGETDGFRLTDQINPLDQRRGITDVEFESTILPIWLAKTEFYVPLDSSWIQSLVLEFIFNPNADFEPNRNIGPGNDIHGIWAVNAEIPAGAAYPFDFFHLGSFNQDIEKPDDWDSDYFEYGFKVKTVIHDTILTLNYFYGRDNDPTLKSAPLPPGMEPTAFDGRFVLHPQQIGFYPRFRMSGLTLSRDFERLNISALGGVSPVLRLEALYAFDNTFSTSLPPGMDDFETHDEIRYAVGLDWKIKINFLNPRAYFLISPQFYHRHIQSYPSDYNLMTATGIVKENNYQTTLMISTTYLHNKLEPSFFWLADHTLDGGFFRYQFKYEYSDKWNLTLGAIMISGRKTGLGFQALENKDHIYLTASYKF